MNMHLLLVFCFIQNYIQGRKKDFIVKKTMGRIVQVGDLYNLQTETIIPNFIYKQEVLNSLPKRPKPSSSIRFNIFDKMVDKLDDFQIDVSLTVMKIFVITFGTSTMLFDLYL